MNTGRVNPFADVSNLPTFEPKAKASPAPVSDQIERIAEANGFPSRQPPKVSRPLKQPGRRYKTGRNQQINIKATPQVIERLYKIADDKHIPLGELLEQALNALEKSQA